MDARARIKEILQQQGKKLQTEEGKARKARLLKKLVYCIEYSKLVSNLYVAVLPLLKNYVMVFQSRQPLVHQLHQKQEELFLEFLSCFVKCQVWDT